jgi:hypothetical protein
MGRSKRRTEDTDVTNEDGDVARKDKLYKPTTDNIDDDKTNDVDAEQDQLRNSTIPEDTNEQQNDNHDVLEEEQTELDDEAKHDDEAKQGNHEPVTDDNIGDLEGEKNADEKPLLSYSDLTPEMIRKYTLFPTSTLIRSHIRDDVHIQTFLELSQSASEDVEGTISIGFLYRIKHYKSGTNDSANERERYRVTARNNQGPLYNRMFFFGTLEGLTFVVIHQNQRNATSAMTEMNKTIPDPFDRIGVGRPFVIIEPRAKKQSELRRDMLIVKTSYPFIPLNDAFARDIGDIHVRLPDNATEDRFFLVHKQQFNLRSICLIGKGSNEIPSCSGDLCDRQTEPLTNIGCGCFTMNSKLSPYVMKVDIVKKNKNEGNGKLPFALDEYRSLRLAHLYIKSGDPIGYSNSEERTNMEFEFRSCVKQLTTIINNYGGFDMMGIVRRGEVGEESEQMEGKAITRIKTLGEATFIPCYLFPSQFEKVLADERFQELRYVAPQFHSGT